MGITVYWDNTQKTIIRQAFSSSWTWDEYLAAYKQVNDLAGEVNHEVGIIAELESVEQVPPDAIKYGSQVLSNMAANVALFVLVMPSPLVLSLGKTITTLISYNKMTTTASVEKARTLIELKIKNSSIKNQRD